MKTYKPLFTLFIAAAALSACNNDDDAQLRNPLAIPSAYDGTSFEANSATEMAVLSQLAVLTNKAKEGRVNGVEVSYNELDALYQAGNPSLKDVSTPYFATLMHGEGAYLYELAKASGGTYVPGPPTGEGGTLGGYLFDENGLELEQLLEKGQFGAVLYKHATDLLQGPVTPQTVDKLLAVFGANPTFPNTPNAASTPSPDRFMANYAARRDKNDGQGLYSQMKNAFIKLQAAAKAGAIYDAEKQEAIDALILTWEKVNAATAINYCHTTISTLSATNPSNDQIGNALHAYGEGVGFIHGWKTIPAQYKRISDAEIDEILVLFNAPANGTPTSYKFVTDPVNELPKLQQIIEQLQDIYGFTDQEIEDFRSNWVTVQGR
jgi:hypothetical protein